MIKNLYPKLQALSAAVLFGISTPFTKLLLKNVEPVLLASLLYLGTGFGLLLIRIIQRFKKREALTEANLTLKDMPFLFGAILAGGVAAPVLLIISLKNTPAATASLLLNFEGVATSVIAVLIFKESLGKNLWTAVFLITGASIILTWDKGGEWGFSPGAAGVILSCIFWGIDNNLTRNISGKSPVTITIVKGFAAGTVSLFIALLTENCSPRLQIIFLSLVLGFFCYGISLILFILAMRSLGAARASAFFGGAPFFGTLLSLFLFRESLGTTFILSLPVMITGFVFILLEDHLHPHKHEYLEHEHRHSHYDNHHNHSHEGEEKKEHTHWHTHEEMTHEHPHTPDIHHRHVHEN